MFQLDKSAMNFFFSKDDFDSQNVILKNERMRPWEINIHQSSTV